MTYTHAIRVRYGECDMQKVVFNAHYWAYCDDAVDRWMRVALGAETGVEEFTETGFDFMLKSATGTWYSPVVFGDTVDIDCTIKRWGSSSFDVSAVMKVEGDVRFEATLVYVSVDLASRRPMPVPNFVREALGD